MQLKLKKKTEETYEDLDKVCQETAKVINGLAKELTSNMWKMGRILVEARKRVKDQFKGAFYAGVANHMKEDIPLSTLYKCAKLYERIPDFCNRLQKTGLSTTHYLELSYIPDEEKREEFEDKAVERDWSVSELKHEIRMERPEIALAEAVEGYQTFTSALTELRESFGRLKKSQVKGVLSKNQLDGLGRTLFYFVKVELPEMVRFLDDNGAIIDPIFKDYMKKFEVVE